jgi:hypothetical protein
MLTVPLMRVIPIAAAANKPVIIPLLTNSQPVMLTTY